MSVLKNETRKNTHPLGDGTTPLEVLSMTFFVPLTSILIWLLVYGMSLSPRLTQCIEVCALNVILLLGLTLLKDHLSLVLVALVLTIFVSLYVLLLKRVANPQIKHVLKNISTESTAKKDINYDYVGGYRGHLLLATAICILAVDFDFFPSRFAKTITYGWSIMDAGVGSFVVVHGLCSSHGRSFTAKHGMKKCFLSSLPLFVLGFLRLIAISAIGYHKVIPEYGVHWNFFFTLAFTKMICYTILCQTNISPDMLAVSTVITHQLLLSQAGLTDLVLSNSRSNLFEQNKEGLSSLLGFVTLYFCGVSLGKVIWKQGSQLSDYIHLFLKLCVIGMLGWLLMYLVVETIQPVSRRMANLPYCIWVVSLTTLQLAVHLFQELVTISLSRILKNNYCDFILWKIINYNGLNYFLLANLLTGFVNVTVNTGLASTLKSFVVLVIYLGLLSAFSFVTFKKSVQLKFW